jgi:RimJ/RimL family protein N-acetyltransferase
MTELTDVSGAFGYGDSILVGERVRLRGTRDDDLPALAKWEMDPGRMATLSSWVVPPSEAAAKERIAKWSANEKAGFVEEGRLRESVLHDGRWYDEVLMSILDHEWAARRSSGR